MNNYENNPSEIDIDSLNWFKRWAAYNYKTFNSMVFFCTMCLGCCVFFYLLLIGYFDFYPIRYNLGTSFCEFIIALSGGVNFYHVAVYLISFMVLYSIIPKCIDKFVVNRIPGVLTWAFLRGNRNGERYIEDDYNDYRKRKMAETKIVNPLKIIIALIFVSRIPVIALYIIDYMTAVDSYTCKTVFADKYKKSEKNGYSYYALIYVDGVQFSLSVREKVYNDIKIGDSTMVHYRKGFFGFLIIDREHSSCCFWRVKSVKKEVIHEIKPKTNENLVVDADYDRQERDSLLNVLKSELYKTKELVKEKTRNKHYKGEDGRSAVTFKVSTDGSITGDITVEQSLTKSIDKVMVEVAENMKYWEPAKILKIENPVEVSLFVKYRDGLPAKTGYRMWSTTDKEDYFNAQMRMNSELEEDLLSRRMYTGVDMFTTPMVERALQKKPQEQ